MVLSESDNIAYGNTDTKPNSPLQEDMIFKDSSLCNSLSRQNSLFSLTLNEIQHKSGKSFGSMNMDEFLANLWNVEENQVPNHHHQQRVKADEDVGDNNNNNNNNNGGGFINPINPPPLGRQGSFSIPAPLCKKTVDEVWFEIQKEDQQPENQKPNHIDALRPPPQRQLTLGEMTLEDFLVKAGIVQEAPGPGAGRVAPVQKMVAVVPMQNMNACLDASFGMGQAIGMGFSAHQSMGNNFLAGNGGFAPYQMFPQPPTDHAKNDQGDLAAQQGKKRIIDGPPEVVVERRQRRMIKNRESAARSRARKQAYTVELELELNQLKEENAKLKQLVEEIELNRKEEVMKRKPSKMKQKKADKLKSIRRTVSLAW